MAILRTGFVAILMVCAASASQPLESARDQYKAHEDESHPPQLLSEATDQAVGVHKSVESISIFQNQYNKQSKVYNKLHSLPVMPQDELKSVPQKKIEEQKVEDPRQRRSIDGSGIINFGTNYYNPWTPSVATIVGVPPYSSFSIWQPQYYQIRRPYYIPLWGSPGKIPLYFPPQPLYVNTGYPADNPPRDYLPPNKGYLPPDPNMPTSAPDNSTLVPTMDKFGEGIDDRPVWGAVPNSGMPTTSTGMPTTSTIKPTRRTRLPGLRTTHPPLVHNAESGGSAGNNLAVATTTTRPFTSAQRPPSSTQRPPSSAQRPPSSTQRPSLAQRPPNSVQNLPDPEQNQVSDVRQPSRCVWAIVSCCSTASQDISYRCFEQLGCSGAFWDTNPCDSEFARAAVANVMKYYNKK